MKRREFIKKGAAAGLTGPAVINMFSMNNLFDSRTGLPLGSEIVPPCKNKLVIKPVLTSMYHTDIWEGPCRWEGKTTEQELKEAANSLEWFRRRVKALPVDRSTADILESGQVLFNEDFVIREEEYKKIDKDASTADVLFIDPSGCSISNYEVANRYKKPVVLSQGINCRTVDVSAYLRSLGIPCYIPNSDEETRQTFNVLKARKNFSQTRILFPTDWKWPSVCSIAGINHPEKLKEQFGIELVVVSYDELSKEMDLTLSDRSFRKEAVALADTIYNNADHSYIDKKYVVNSLEFYQAVVNLMKKHNCNSFTIECFEFCTSRLPQKWGITPCLIHTMLKDTGIPSACEGDLGGLLAMHMLMLLSDKSPHFGNMFYREGVMTVNHSVPGIRMNGYDKPGLPYQLGRFTKTGFGTNVVVDFMKNDTRDVTVARMNPAGKGLLVLKGTLVGSKGWGEDLIGCAVSAYIVGKESGTAEEFVRKQMDYGNHLSWVYGDYCDQLIELGAVTGVEVTVVS
jgi:hypothetical protein